MAQSRIERLMNLVAFLSDATTPKTIREIIEVIPGYPANFESARRAFERDKEELRAMNFDISVEANPQGDNGYRISKETTFFDVELTAAQRSIVQYALELYGPERSVSSSALTKLGGMNPESEVREVTPLPMPDIIDELYSACLSKDPIDIDFKGSTRRVVPQRLIARGGYWYLETFDLSRNDKRTFRADRIVSVSPTDQEYSAMETQIEDEPEDTSIRVSVKSHPHLRQLVCDTWNGTYDPVDDVITFSLPRSELFSTRIFDYAGFVSIVSPPELVDAVTQSFDVAMAALGGDA